MVSPPLGGGGGAQGEKGEKKGGAGREKKKKKKKKNPDGDEIFRPSRPALRPTQPPVKWVPGVSRR